MVKNDGEGNTHGLHGSSVDVALALQYFVEGSRLQLHSSCKSGLPGFYDVAPAEEKVLYVLYMFKGKLHEVFVDDEAPLMLPLKSHYLPDAAQRRV
jgi:DnaJ homolog subfamily C member 11